MNLLQTNVILANVLKDCNKEVKEIRVNYNNVYIKQLLNLPDLDKDVWTYFDINDAITILGLIEFFKPGIAYLDNKWVVNGVEGSNFRETLAKALILEHYSDEKINKLKDEINKWVK